MSAFGTRDSSRGDTAGPTPRRMRGLLQKRSADGSWKNQLFSLHRHKLCYEDLRKLGESKSEPHASLDLLDVVRVERTGQKLYLWVDDRRKHQLRSARTNDDLAGLCPSLDEWEEAIQERIAFARQRRRKRDLRPPLTPTVEMPTENPAAIDAAQSRGHPPYWESGVLEDKPDADDDETDSYGHHDDAAYDRDFYRRQIIEFYQRHNSEKVPDVDALIVKYNEIGIGEKDLLAAIQNKYEKMRFLSGNN